MIIIIIDNFCVALFSGVHKLTSQQVHQHCVLVLMSAFSASSGQAMRPATAMSPSFSPSSGQPVRPATAMSPSFSTASGQPVGPAMAMSPSFSAASGQPVGPATVMSPSFSAASGQPVRPVMAMSPYRRSALYTSWLVSGQQHFSQSFQYKQKFIYTASKYLTCTHTSASKYISSTRSSA